MKEILTLLASMNCGQEKAPARQDGVTTLPPQSRKEHLPHTFYLIRFKSNIYEEFLKCLLDRDAKREKVLLYLPRDTYR
jgi:hypothetical protein